jgi:hypothetical protein
VLAISIAFVVAGCFQESYSGIFIVSNAAARKTACENELKMVVGKARVCVAKKPILGLKEIQYITNILYNPQRKVYYVDIGISQAGIQTLAMTTRSLPKSRFALVVSGEVVCLFYGSPDYAISSVRVGEDASLKELTLIHDALKTARE